LEAEIVAQRKEAEKRENILTSHLKEISEDLNKLEAEFSQQERRLEEEIVSLKTQLEEAKRKEEVMKIQMMKKEEDCEKLEEEVVTLRVKVVKLNKNTEERESSTSSVKKVEGKCYRLLERKNEEKDKSYAEVIKGPIKKEECEPSKKNIPEMKKTQEEDYKRDGYQRRPSTFRYQRSFNHCEGNNIREDHDQPRHEFRRTTSQRRSFTPRYQSLFYGHCFTCNNFGHKVVDCRAYGRNGQARNVYVTPYNIECYKCHNYGHIARDCRSMMDTSMKENIDIRYKKVWKRKKKNR
jgi:hypothetical protein